MKFSERKKFRKIKLNIQIKRMSPELRNLLWNILQKEVWEWYDIDYSNKSTYNFETPKLRRHIWGNYFEERIDAQPHFLRPYIRNYYFKCKWYDVYDFIESILAYLKRPVLEKQFNEVLEKYFSGYRFVKGICTNITNQEEIEMLEEALNDNEYPGVNIHLKQALKLLSDKKNPDYRNSIKESISAVESISKIITGKPKSTLAEALKILDKKKTIHNSLAQSFLKLYGYTSDEIRHSILKEPDLTVNDAKFFLLSCTSFINYLKTKM